MGHDAVLTPTPASPYRKSRQGGQAIIMVTLALIAMCGLLGLAVDFGWAYFVKRAAQTAADAAALAAAEEFRVLKGAWGPYADCAGSGTCRNSAPVACPATVTSIANDNVDNACMYAAQHGFVNSGRQHVTYIEDVSVAPPTVPGVPLQYWITVRVTEEVPQLFSAVMGNPMAIVSARATAGLYLGDVRDSLILLNRRNEDPNWGGNDVTGINLDVFGNARVVAGGGIRMASTCHGDCGRGNWAGMIQGDNSSVTAPSTNIMGDGYVDHPERWTTTPNNGGGEGKAYQDPTQPLAQVPVSPQTRDCEVRGGVIASTDNNTVMLAPGNYFSTAWSNSLRRWVATGEPVRIQGNVQFTAGGSECFAGVSTPAGFSDYVFYGGIDARGATHLNFESGRVVLAGAIPANGNNNPGIAGNFEVGGQGIITGPGSSAAGNVFIATTPDYPGLRIPPQMEADMGSGLPALKQGTIQWKSGNNGNAEFTLDGLNKENAALPSELHKYDNVLMWNDRKNSTTRYSTTNGSYDCTDPATMLNCGKTNQELQADRVVGGSNMQSITAGALTQLRGIIYQPRGAYSIIHAASDLTEPLQIVTGAMRVGGGGTVNLLPVTSGLPLSIVGLVE